MEENNPNFPHLVFSFVEVTMIIISGRSNIDSCTIYPQLGLKI